MMQVFHNEDQRKLHDFIKKHGTWSAADLIKHEDVQRWMKYRKSAHREFRHRLAGKIQWLRRRLKKFGLVEK